MEGILRKTRARDGIAADPAEDDAPGLAQDPLVASVMEEEQAKKRAKKGEGSHAGKKQKRKGLTLEEVEEMEGGVIKESKVGMAASRRADRRKQRQLGDETEMLAVNDLVEVEEALEQDEDDGNKLEPFNLAKEREEGHFDEGGNYVENKEDDDPTLKDAWLTSEDAGVVSDEVRRKVEEQQRRMASADAAPEITPQQTADLMRKLIKVLLPGETVTKALRRLQPQAAPSNKGKKREAKKELTEEERQAKMEFDSLTETASTLMDAGELDVYSTSREDFEAREKNYPEENDDFDMFGDASTEISTKRPAVLQPAAPVASQDSKQPIPLPSTTTAQQKSEEAYDSWPIKELARFLKERGQDTSGITEKADLVARVRKAAAVGPEGEQPRAPTGYVWDPTSGYFFSREAGMYYDANSASFYSSGDGKWWRYDEDQEKYLEILGN